jgi:hypothetical protein
MALSRVNRDDRELCWLFDGQLGDHAEWSHLSTDALSSIYPTATPSRSLPYLDRNVVVCADFIAERTIDGHLECIRFVHRPPALPATEATIVSHSLLPLDLDQQKRVKEMWRA